MPTKVLKKIQNLNKLEGVELIETPGFQKTLKELRLQCRRLRFQTMNLRRPDSHVKDTSPTELQQTFKLGG